MREFSIHLNNRKTEYDLLVYNITYHDGLTAFNRLVLDCCLDSLSTQHYIGAQHKIALDSDIDRLVATVSNKLAESGVAIDSDVRLSSRSFFSGENKVELTSSQLNAIMSALVKAESSLAISASKIETSIASTILDEATTSIALGFSVDSMFEHDFEQVSSDLCLNTSVEESAIVSVDAGQNGLILDSYVSGLFYKMAASAQSALSIISALEDIMIKFSLGNIINGIGVSSSFEDESEFAIKYFGLDEAVSLLNEAVVIALKCIMPAGNSIGMAQSVSLISVSYRKLNEIDGETLGDLDQDTIANLTYIET